MEEQNTENPIQVDDTSVENGAPVTSEPPTNLAREIEEEIIEDHVVENDVPAAVKSPNKSSQKRKAMPKDDIMSSSPFSKNKSLGRRMRKRT